MGLLMVGRETWEVWYEWNVEKGVHFWCRIRDGKISPVLWTCVGGPDSVSSREKVEERLICSCKFGLF